MKKNNKPSGITLTGFKTYIRAVITKIKHSTGIKTDTETYGTEHRLRNKHPSTSNWVSTKALQAHIGAKTTSSINSAGKTRYPHSEDWNMTSASHHVQKSTQNRLKSQMYNLILWNYWKTWEKFQDTSKGNEILDMTPKVQETKENRENGLHQSRKLFLLLFCFLVVLTFELKTSLLVGRRSTTWDSPAASKIESFDVKGDNQEETVYRTGENIF
jgi:hypothetical protein